MAYAFVGSNPTPSTKTISTRKDYMSEPLSRDYVIDAWKSISAQGFGDPAEIGELLTGKPKTEEMLRAEQLYDAWYKSESDKPKSREQELRLQYDITTLYVDAGFAGQDYLEEVANDWLSQDAASAEEQGFTELASEIKAKIDEINSRLESN
ncbi:MAG: hypothetical protein QG659_515 [Patescibacteria group bacterium]|jgi:hypothetical protein|nr:hypothetical protein [Patescibacteria group bacterium]